MGFPLHDPTAVAYFIDPKLFRTQSGPVRVATSGIARGETILGDNAGRSYAENHWSDIPPSAACKAVNSDAVVRSYRASHRRPLSRLQPDVFAQSPSGKVRTRNMANLLHPFSFIE